MAEDRVELPTDLEGIRAAAARIAGQVVRTPCDPAPAFADEVPGALWFKFENRQRTGSFKDRGAANKLLQLGEEERRRGIVTASAGNHAQAVAYHATALGIPATVVMPTGTPLIKVSKTRRYGARVVQTGVTLTESLDEARRLEEVEGRVMVHPFDDPRIIEGQGTVALELIEQVPDLTQVIVPIGGGGLISGIAIALKALRPDVRVVGVEATAAPSAHASLRAGHVVKIESAETIADGIAVKRIGDLTFPVIRALVDEVVLVDEESIASAILKLLERERTVVEGAGATPLAALLAGAVRCGPADVTVALLCGGNIDVNMVSRIIDRGLVADGRIARLMVRVRDRPGALAGLTRIVAEAGANVLEIAHRRAFADISVGDVGIVMHLETRGRDHVDEIIQRLEACGHTVVETA
ncbi:MAG: threonine ammonia-lyase [Gemmatimonadetes bacterium]|nr:MAG: threonine ammonia-lyase [Gemmatimonadota bacterium]